MMDYLIVTEEGEPVARTVYAEDAAALVAALGHGTTVRYLTRKGALLWEEGAEEIPAAESYDDAAQVIAARAMTACWGTQARGA